MGDQGDDAAWWQKVIPNRPCALKVGAEDLVLVTLVEFVKNKNLSLTGSMVFGLLTSLPKIPYHYTIYLDNYSTSVCLFKTL